MSSAGYYARIREQLRNAESGVQKIIADAAASGDYEAIEAARRVAVDLKRMSGRIAEVANNISNADLRISLALPGDSNPSFAWSTSDEGTGKNSPGTRTASRPQGRSETGYPRFESKNGVLHRIGWSKKRKSEYVHKVPRSSFDVIMDLLGRIAKQGEGPVPAESIIEALDRENEAIPTYQVYAVLMFLRQLGAVEQVGRDGYRIPVDISQRKDALWPS